MRPYFRSIVLRIIIAPFIVVVLRDLPSPVFFSKKSPGTDHLQHVGSIFSLPRVNTEGKLSIFAVNCQAIEIRLTYLLPELLKLVDEGKIALTPAVYFSYLSAEQQRWVHEEMKRNDCIPSVSQAYRLKEESQAETLTPEAVAVIMGKEKVNKKETLKIPIQRVRKFFPASYTTAQIEEEIVKLCETRYRTVITLQQ